MITSVQLLVAAPQNAAVEEDPGIIAGKLRTWFISRVAKI